MYLSKNIACMISLIYKLCSYTVARKITCWQQNTECSKRNVALDTQRHIVKYVHYLNDWCIWIIKGIASIDSRGYTKGLFDSINA